MTPEVQASGRSTDNGQPGHSRRSPNGSSEGPHNQPEAKVDPIASTKPPTSKLLSAAKRAHDFKKEGRGPSRQLDIQLRSTPISGVYFRSWPNPDDEYPVAILKVKTDDDRKEIFILSVEVADLPHVATKVREASLVPCVTSTGRVFVWAKTIPDPADRLGFRIFDGLARAGEEARKRWILISWDSGALTIEDPREPIMEEPRWPSGQPLEEIYEIAIRGAFIDNPDHPVIRRLDTIAREI
jgi:hypothetical protein